MNKLYTCFLVTFLIYSVSANAANELYINGQAGAISATTPTLFDSTGLLFVNGEIINNQGLFVNSGGTVELSGKRSNTPAANSYQSTGTEKFYSALEQTISGTMNGTTKIAAGYNNQLYDLKSFQFVYR